MFLNFRKINQCYQSWFYLGLLLWLCCQSAAVQAADKAAISQTAPSAGAEMPISPVSHEDRDKNVTVDKSARLQGANADQFKADQLPVGDKQAASVSELEQKQKSIYLEINKKIDINAKDIESQKVLIENYAAGGFETLLKMADLNEKVDKMLQGDSLAAGQKTDERQAFSKNLNHLWMLVVIFLVSLAPLAFTASPGHGVQSQQQWVLFVCLSAFLGYFLLGFGLMFGASASGWIGLSSPVFAQQPGAAMFAAQEFMLYQMSFPILAALIILKGLGQDVSSRKSVLLALCIGAVVVPVFGHWAAAGRYISDNSGWLEAEGFLDNAGTTTIHAIAAWFILVWARRLGGQNSLASDSGQTEADAAYSVGGVIFLWLSTLGLVTGVLSITSEQIPIAMLNVGLAAAGAALGGFLYGGFDSKQSFNRSLGGVVAALAAIGASAALVTNLEAIMIGACASLIYHQAYKLVRKRLLPQPDQDLAADLVAMHGVGGVWGSLCLALFGSVGLLGQPKITLLIAQLEGICTALIYSVVLANILFLLFNMQRKNASR